ncbi:hypothetical protein ACWGTI_05145 [Mesorhizobium sp. ArgA1]
MIELRPLRDPEGAPLDAGGPASILAAIMALAKGFARDGIGASLLGFEIFVRWTSFRKSSFMPLCGRTSFEPSVLNHVSPVGA